MGSPYTPLDFDGTVGHSGTAHLFPLNTQTGQDLELPAAINALFYNDISRWPTGDYYLDTEGLESYRPSLPLFMKDDGATRIVANWIAWKRGWLNGYVTRSGLVGESVDNPLGGDPPGTEYDPYAQADAQRYDDPMLGSINFTPSTFSYDCGGTIPYVNPANVQNPDAAYGINFVLDLDVT